jgi:hypothetical protein
MIKAKDHSPIGPNGYSPEAFHLALERVQPKPRQVYMSNIGRDVKRRQNIPQLFDVFGIYAARSSSSKRRFSPLWRMVFIIAYRNAPRVACQHQC